MTYNAEHPNDTTAEPHRLVDGADRNGRWYPCDHLPAVPSLDQALAVLDDPRHAFWG